MDRQIVVRKAGAAILAGVACWSGPAGQLASF